MKKVYAVIFHNGSWGNPGDHLIGIFDNEAEAEKQCELFKQVRQMYDDDDYVFVDEQELLSEAFTVDSEWAYYF